MKKIFPAVALVALSLAACKPAPLPLTPAQQAVVRQIDEAKPYSLFELPGQNHFGVICPRTLDAPSQVAIASIGVAGYSTSSCRYAYHRSAAEWAKEKNYNVVIIDPSVSNYDAEVTRQLKLIVDNPSSDG